MKFSLFAEYDEILFGNSCCSLITMVFCNSLLFAEYGQIFDLLPFAQYDGPLDFWLFVEYDGLLDFVLSSGYDKFHFVFLAVR